MCHADPQTDDIGFLHDHEEEYDSNPRPSYALIDTEGDRVANIKIERVEYDVQKVSDALADIDLPMAAVMSKRVLTVVMKHATH